MFLGQIIVKSYIIKGPNPIHWALICLSAKKAKFYIMNRYKGSGSCPPEPEMFLGQIIVKSYIIKGPDPIHWALICLSAKKKN